MLSVKSLYQKDMTDLKSLRTSIQNATDPCHPQNRCYPIAQGHFDVQKPDTVDTEADNEAAWQAVMNICLAMGGKSVSTGEYTQIAEIATECNEPAQICESLDGYAQGSKPINGYSQTHEPAQICESVRGDSQDSNPIRGYCQASKPIRGYSQIHNSANGYSQSADSASGHSQTAQLQNNVFQSGLTMTNSGHCNTNSQTSAGQCYDMYYGQYANQNGQWATSDRHYSYSNTYDGATPNYHYYNQQDYHTQPASVTMTTAPVTVTPKVISPIHTDSSSNNSNTGSPVSPTPSTRSRSGSFTLGELESERTEKRARRNRTTFSVHQISKLEAWFCETKYPDVYQLQQISADLQLREDSVRVWFKNRRQNHRISNSQMNSHGQKRDVHLSELNAERCVKRARKNRTSFTEEQMDKLESAFIEKIYPDVHQREQIAADMGVQEEVIRVWFKNKRQKLKRKFNQDKESINKTYHMNISNS